MKPGRVNGFDDVFRVYTTQKSNREVTMSIRRKGVLGVSMLPVAIAAPMMERELLLEEK